MDTAADPGVAEGTVVEGGWLGMVCGLWHYSLSLTSCFGVSGNMNPKLYKTKILLQTLSDSLTKT